MDSASGTISSSVSGHRILCAIISHAKSHRRDTIRKTWLPLVTPEVDAKFFVGTHDEKLEDEVIKLKEGKKDIEQIKQDIKVVVLIKSLTMSKWFWMGLNP